MPKYRINDKTYQCPTELTLAMIGGKWKLIILWHLVEEKKRYGELRKLIPEITHKMLTQQLRELEEDKIINRIVHNVIPPHVEYSLAARGEQLKPMLALMVEWGLNVQREYLNESSGEREAVG